MHGKLVKIYLGQADRFSRELIKITLWKSNYFLLVCITR